ncbi:glucokinase [Methylomonas fluvii]|uniref:Glucokinase n=1 Tax=Methylomonas fluvii TaxID=1854564 RepID=A0ABR9D7H1_9GAMM|nr:glucokinase [Methylomonas fluvii]MBD9359057.1 glucokinase [Methylomonas fluvii]CAD6871729.1 Glucokinase (EC 2.7.1.2) [Methylomonas fluvii]
MILAGDIGGTKTVLALLDRQADGTLSCLQEQTFASGEFQTFEEILDLFLSDNPPVSSACFGIAGPVVNQRCQTTNLPWLVDGEQLKLRLGTERVKLLNDLEAMAIGMLHLRDQDFIELNPDAEPQTGNIAVIAAGTGLGEAILHWDGEQYNPIATEGGHCDFAPQNPQQDQLLIYLRDRYPAHVSCERVLSGIGFSNIYDFLAHIRFAPPCPAVPPAGETRGVDRNALISRLGVDGEDPLCRETVRLFAELYGAEAGNLALKAFATGGVFIGGGIGPKIRSVLESGEFIQAFVAKGRFQPMLTKLSVKLALNPRTPLLGAMHYFAGQ